jgi:hypothetical protein
MSALDDDQKDNDTYRTIESNDVQLVVSEAVVEDEQVFEEQRELKCVLVVQC